MGEEREEKGVNMPEGLCWEEEELGVRFGITVFIQFPLGSPWAGLKGNV